MSKQVSPFASLTGAEKQIRWLEYQSIKLPYVEAEIAADDVAAPQKKSASNTNYVQPSHERPQPPPEVPRTYHPDFQKTRHSQYDAVIARLKQADLQARMNSLQAAQQPK